NPLARLRRFRSRRTHTRAHRLARTLKTPGDRPEAPAILDAPRGCAASRRRGRWRPPRPARLRANGRRIERPAPVGATAVGRILVPDVARVALATRRAVAPESPPA